MQAFVFLIGLLIASLDLPLDDNGSVYPHSLMAESEKAIPIAQESQGWFIPSILFQQSDLFDEL